MVNMIVFPDETNLPADIPSYLSSQGTLADRQDGYIPSESGSGHHYMASSVSGFYLQPKDMSGNTSFLFLLSYFCRPTFFLRHTLFAHAGLCQLDTGSEADMEAAIDPLLYHYKGPIGSFPHRDQMYSNDLSEDFPGLHNFLNKMLHVILQQDCRAHHHVLFINPQVV